ncbi:MAG TPA: PAS domain-containing protein [Actinomycetota bacterium]|nr:PAS domain-containing protein [Actinomycetota bacterium]
MRQWELIGITDDDPMWTAPARTEADGAPVSSPVTIDHVAVDPADRGNGTAFLWATDLSLNLRSVSSVASVLLGRDPEACEGRELLDVVGMEGPSLAVLEAHVAALAGDDGSFSLRGDLVSVRCRVTPLHGEDGRIIGTFCMAIPHDPALGGVQELYAIAAA